MELTRNQNGGQNMLYNYFTEKLLGLQGVLIENIEEIDDTIHIYCKLERKIHKCPVCGNHTDKIHDYREQIIKDIPAFGKFVFIHLKKRRYSCSCGKRFYEKNSFLPRFHRMTNRLVAYVIDKLRCEASFTSVANEVNLSLPTVIRIFDLVSYSLKELPTALSIDEMYVYTGIGRETIRELTKQPEAKQFTLKIGKRTLIKRKQFEEYLDQMCSI
jgi:transposase